MRKKIFLSSLVLAIAVQCQGALLQELSEQEILTLNSGQNVLKTIEKPNATWPEVKIYRRVNAEPKVVTDLFLDYENANTYIENLKSAVVENSPSPNTKDVRYTVKLPVLFTINYLVRNQYRQTPEGYTVSWRLLDSLLAKTAVGSLKVEPYEGDSIICYANHVEPATSLVAGLKGHAIKEASKTVDAITKEAQRRQTTK